MPVSKSLELILLEGESSTIEFKERLSNLDREIVAFANTKGGIIYIGVNDQGAIVGTELSNGLRSQLFDIARNCDPGIDIEIKEYRQDKVVAIIVGEGNDKPYRCRDGFFVRVGPCSQKLTRNEIVYLIKDSPQINFDETLNKRFKYPDDFSKENFEKFKMLSNIPKHFNDEDILLSLNLVGKQKDQMLFTNAAILLFAAKPQKFFPESYISCVCYNSLDRFDILDKKDIYGNLIDQIEESLLFIKRHISMQIQIHAADDKKLSLGQRKNFYDYPLVALREAVVNAVTHRDYFYDGAHIYIHIFPDRIEVENPGGLYHGLKIENLGHRSVRRNRLIADLLHRADYVERVGSGFSRMQHALEENNNPPLEVVATNFFVIKFIKRIPAYSIKGLSQRQLKVIELIQQQNSITKQQLAKHLHVSNDTILRALKQLMELKIIKSEGQGKSTFYSIGE